MRTVYDILNRDRELVATLNSQEEAYEYTLVMQLEEGYYYTIVERTVHTVTGLGRDPDLH